MAFSMLCSIIKDWIVKRPTFDLKNTFCFGFTLLLLLLTLYMSERCTVLAEKFSVSVMEQDRPLAEKYKFASIWLWALSFMVSSLMTFEKGEDKGVDA